MITLEQSIEMEPRLAELRAWVVGRSFIYSDELYDEWREFYSEFKRWLGDLVGWFRKAEDSYTKNPELMNSGIWDIWINWFLEVTGY